MITGTWGSGKYFHQRGLLGSNMVENLFNPKLERARIAPSCSVTIKTSMGSNSELTREGAKGQLTSKPSQSSTTTRTTSTPKLSDDSELQEPASPLGTAAERLLQEDDRRELFQGLPETHSMAHRFRRHGWSTLRYLTQTEVHTYAFSVAANAILSFFPFIVLLLTLIRRVIHSQAMYNVVLELLRDYLPSNKDFVIRNLQFLASVRGRGQVLSFVMLLITSTGIFLPLEVALNRIWGFKKNRLLPHEPVDVAGTWLGMWLPGDAFDRADRAEPEDAGTGDRRPELRLCRTGIHGDEGFGDHGDHRDLLPDLLGTPTRQGSRASGAAGSHYYRFSVGGGESTSTFWRFRG